MAEAGIAALEVRGLSVDFGRLPVLNEVSLVIPKGEHVGIIGPNGAGKTTLFNAICGYVSARGRVMIAGNDVSHRRPHERARMGLARSFQLVSLCSELTVFDNILMAVTGRSKRFPFGLARPALSRRDLVNGALDVADAAGLNDQLGTRVSELSYGLQRRLDLVVSIAGSPSVILLDEPSAGLTRAEMVEVASLVKGLPDDLTVVLIDHDIDTVLSVSDRVVVLHQGRIIADARPGEILESDAVRLAYWGG